MFGVQLGSPRLQNKTSIHHQYYQVNIARDEHSTRHAAGSETEKSLGSCGGLLKLDSNSEHYDHVP